MVGGGFGGATWASKKKVCVALGLQPPPNGCQLGRPKLSILASNLGPILARSWRRLDAQERLFDVQLGGGPLSSIKSHLGASWVVLGAATDSEPPRRRRGAAKIPPRGGPCNAPQVGPQKNRSWASRRLQDPPKMGPKLDPKKFNFGGSSWPPSGRGLGAQGRRRAIFWRPKLPPIGSPPPKRRFGRQERNQY